MNVKTQSMPPTLTTEETKYAFETDIMSLEWWQKNIIYHVYLPSFKDSNNDGIGDFQGLISKLKYFEDLKIKTLLLSPFYQSPMKDNGYDVSSYIDIHPDFGTMHDFDEFMGEVKKKDLNIIVDLIANHSSDQHPWFQKSINREPPYSDYYIWANASPHSTESRKLPPNNWLSVFGGSAWTWNEQRKQFYLHQFLPEQPDFNFRNPAVIEEMKKVMVFWLEKGVDGFRIDAASHLFEDVRLLDEPVDKKSKARKNEHGYLEHIYTKAQKENLVLLKEFRKVLDEFENRLGKAKIMMTEATDDINDIMKHYGTVGDCIAHFPFNFQLYRLKTTSTGVDLFELIDLWLKNMPKGKYPNWVLSSHDDPRISRLGKRLASSLYMVIMLLPGIPFCYFGDELGMENTYIKEEEIRDSFALRTSPLNSRDPMRTPMQWTAGKNSGFSDSNKTWLPIHKNYRTVNAEAEMENPDSFLNFFKSSLRLRDEPSVLVGLLLFPLVTEEIFSFLRYLEKAKCYLLVLNMSSKCTFVDLSKASPLLPDEGNLELSNGHILESEIESSDTEAPKIAQCRCEKKVLSAASASKAKVSLKCIHLQAKEAVVISFIGGGKS